VIEIDAASNRSVDDARDLRERAMYAASQEDRYKVYIVDEAHMLTREAWNALLKILEEPPPRVVFVFATTEPQKIANNAAPVLSRLQRFDFKRIGAGAIRDRVKEVLAAEGLRADDDAIAVIARYADGGMRDALSVLDQALSMSDGVLTAERVRQALGLIGDDVYAEVLGAVARKDAAAIFPVVDRLLAAGTDLVEFANGMAELLRAVLMVATGAVPEGLTAAQREVVTAAASELAAGDVLRMLGLLSQAEQSIRRSANPRLAVETLLIRWAVMDRTVDLEAVLAGAGPAAPRSRQSAPPAPSSAGPAAPPSSPAPAGPLITGSLTIESIADAWNGIVGQARDKSPLLATVIEHLKPVALVGNQLTVTPDDEASHMAEGAKRQLGAIQDHLNAALGQRLVVAVVDPAAASVKAEKPKRLSEKDLKAEKLREFRAKDATLDAAADALDLEIVD
jgi:DNA polymerase-3 subunit gamma/tau